MWGLGTLNTATYNRNNQALMRCMKTDSTELLEHLCSLLSGILDTKIFSSWYNTETSQTFNESFFEYITPNLGELLRAVQGWGGSVNRTSRASVLAWQGASTGKVSPATLDLCCNNIAKASSKRDWGGGRIPGQRGRTGSRGAEAERRTMGQDRGRERSHLMPSQKGPDFRLLLLLTIQFRSLSSITFKPNKAQPFWSGCWNGEHPEPGEITSEWSTGTQWSLSFSSAVPPDKSQRCCLG